MTHTSRGSAPKHDGNSSRNGVLPGRRAGFSRGVAVLAVVACLATGLGLVAVVFRMAERPVRAHRASDSDKHAGPPDDEELDWDDEHAWDLGA